MIEVQCKPMGRVRVMAFNAEQTELRVSFRSVEDTRAVVLDRTEAYQIANELTGHALVELIQSALALFDARHGGKDPAPFFSRLEKAAGVFVPQVKRAGER